MGAPQLTVVADAAAAAAHGADLVAAQLREGIAARGRASLAVSGGRTPQRMFEDPQTDRLKLFLGQILRGH